MHSTLTTVTTHCTNSKLVIEFNVVCSKVVQYCFHEKRKRKLTASLAFILAVAPDSGEWVLCAVWSRAAAYKESA